MVWKLEPALVVLALAVTACGDKVTFIECPPGTRPEGSRCIPEDVPDTSGADSATVDPDTSVTTTTTTDTATADEDTATATGPDTTDVATPQPTGSACLKNADCAGGTCLDWTGGYCSTLGCSGDSCGAGQACITFQGNAICVATCDDAGDCRAPDQACKALVQGDALVEACVGVDEDAGAIGAGCVDATECQGPATCIASFPGGYCASLGCPANACPSGSACVTVDGQPSCLRTCDDDGDCDSAEGAERKCGVLQTTSGAPVEVCISGISGKDMGASCLSDFECGSGSCQILGEGRCSQTQRPCFQDRVDEDCNGAEFCLVNGQNRVGLCSQPCRAGGFGCPGASYCVAESDDPNDAWCRPACATPGDDPACNTGAGLVCAFGIPLTDGAQGRYVCGRQRTGVLTACNGDTTCGQNSCLLDGASGYCTEGCGDDGYCPFGGACVFGASDRCLRACFSGGDCPDGFACTLPSGATRSVCTP